MSKPDHASLLDALRTADKAATAKGYPVSYARYREELDLIVYAGHKPRLEAQMEGDSPDAINTHLFRRYG